MTKINRKEVRAQVDSVMTTAGGTPRLQEKALRFQRLLGTSSKPAMDLEIIGVEAEKAIATASDYEAQVEQLLGQQADGVVSARTFSGLLVNSAFLGKNKDLAIAGLQVNDRVEAAEKQNAIVQRETESAKAQSEELREFIEGHTDDIEQLKAALHLTQLGESSVRIEDVARMPLSGGRLSDVDRVRLDEIFSSDGDDIDVQQVKAIALLFELALHGNELQRKESLARYKKDGITGNSVSVAAEAGIRAKAYLEYYLGQCMDRIFSSTADTAEIFSEDATLLPLTIATYFLNTRMSGLMPFNFSALLDADAIPGLSEEERGAIQEQFELLYNQRPKLEGDPLTRIDIDGEKLYRLALASYETGHATEYLHQLAAAAQPLENPLDDTGVSPLDALLNQPIVKDIDAARRNYNRLRAFLERGKDGEILRIEGEDLHLPEELKKVIGYMDVAVLEKDAAYIDIILQGNVMLKISNQGRIIGIPADFEGDVGKVINYVVKALLDYGRSPERGAFLPSLERRTKPQPIVSAAAHRSERVDSVPAPTVEEVSIAKPPKRRAAQMLGARRQKQRDLGREEEAVAEQNARVRGAPYIRIPFETIAGLDERLQQSVRRAVRLAESEIGEKGRASHMEPLVDIGPDEFRIKAGRKRIFVHREKTSTGEKWWVTQVEDMRQDNTYAKLKAKLGSKKR